MRLTRNERPNPVWTYDFAQNRTCDGSAYRMFNILDESTREVLMIRVMVLAELQSTELNAATP
ncbi:MAG: hypothetical protein OXI81_19445 [Paracoccaceae bacterium]|nr:hypothetical protein [Paracoccaceae bacterium]MDE2911743.1 hypothetical protein [Paracoccaceae bacterium]